MPTLSITCIETREIGPALDAIERTLSCIPVQKLYWISNQEFPRILQDIQVINVLIREIDDFADDINHIYLRLIPSIISTDFNLMIQADGFAVNPAAWSEEFWNYDYIGAPWPWMWGGGPPWKGPIVGNGGFSLRSKKLYRALNEISIDWILDHHNDDPRASQREYYGILPSGERFIPEDLLVCLWYRDLLESRYSIRFSGTELASQFSIETIHPAMEKWLGKSFGFHGIRAAPYYGVTL